MIRQWLKPTAAGWVLFALLLGVQPMLIVGSGNATATTTSFGLPPLVIVTETTARDGLSGQVSIGTNVHWIAAVVLVSYLLAMTVGRLVSAEAEGVPKRTAWRHPAAVLGIVILAVITVAFGAAVALSRLYSQPAIQMDLTRTSGLYIEIPEWHVNFMGFVLLGLFFVMPITILVMILRRWRERKRASLRGFPVDVGA